jgi:hypothetical protein
MCFADVSDVCCKCLNCFWTHITNILSRCYISKSWCCICCNETYLQQPPNATVRPAYMRVGVQRHQGVGVGTGHEAHAGHRATQIMVRVRNTAKQAPREAGVSCAAVRMLDVPFCI